MIYVLIYIPIGMLVVYLINNPFRFIIYRDHPFQIIGSKYGMPVMIASILWPFILILLVLIRIYNSKIWNFLHHPYDKRDNK
ncbi:MAG: hypothetical protein COA52_01000 [Hyphomicrobiales bacterium]|nr:MAG: hypothetical protein COA52_01000 [Hyphomicrobiales bacterium]